MSFSQQGKAKVVWRALKVTWILACTAILVLTFIYRGPQYRDAVEAEAIIMIAFSFPVGWLFAYLFLGTLIGGTRTTEIQWILLIWVPLFCLGYLQWFVVAPVLAGWIRKAVWHHEAGGPTGQEVKQ